MTEFFARQLDKKASEATPAFTLGWNFLRPISSGEQGFTASSIACVAIHGAQNDMRPSFQTFTTANKNILGVLLP